MSHKSKSNSERENQFWQKRIESELMLGNFISWREISGFRSSLSALLDELTSYAKEHPNDALPIFEVFIAGCLEKSEEVDDSGDDLGSFLEDLICSWSQCCEAAGISGNEYIKNLTRWMEVEKIGYFYDLESTVIPSLGKKYQKALEESLRSRLDEKSNVGRGTVVETLKKLYSETENIPALIGLCEQNGFEEKDYLALASAFNNRNDFNCALEWADKGLKLKDGNLGQYELKNLRRKILKAFGRDEQAESEAWADFEKSPSIFYFERVLELALEHRQEELKVKALPFFDRCKFEDKAVALYKLKELDRLATCLSEERDKSLRSIFYADAIPMAETLSKAYPKQAARIYVAQALEILDVKRSKAYHHAHDYLQSAKTLLEQCGEAGTWSGLVANIRQAHRLKSSFMPGFERIVAGKGAPHEPTFMERIAKRLGPDTSAD